MNKKIACYFTFCVLILGLIPVTLPGTAQTYGGSILTGDGSDPPTYKDYFDLGEDVYYDVYATEEGNYLQYKIIDIFIVGPGGEVYNDTIFTNEFGEASGSWGGTGSPDLYTIYANYTGQNIATATFRVYEPIPVEAEVVTYVSAPRYSGGTPAYYFSSYDRVFFSIYVKDQWNNPYYEVVNPDEIQYWIYHNEEEASYLFHETNDEGYIDDSFTPSWAFLGDDIHGIYQINVTREDWTPIGTTTFEVVDVVLNIIPSKMQYAQGEGITINIQTSITGTIDIQILDPNGDVVPNANWIDQVLTNGQWSGSYTLGLDLPDGNYELRVLKDGNVMESQDITVEKYTLQIWTDSGAYLSGEEMTVHYTITNNKDGSAVTDAAVEWIYDYYDEDDYEFQSIKDSRSSAGPTGTFQVSIPKSSAKTTLWYTGKLYVWANDTSNRSDLQLKDIYLGDIDANVEVENQKFVAGDFVVVTVKAEIDTQWGSYPLRNGDVSLKVLMDGIEIPVYTKSNLKTDLRGFLTYIFILQSDIEVGVYTITVNVSKSDTDEWDTASDSFEVMEFREMSVEVGFDNKYYSEDDHPQYYSGELVRVTYTTYKGEDIVEDVNCEYRVYYGSNFIATGTSSSGEFTFIAPTNFIGVLTVYVEITDPEGYKAYHFAYVDVARAGMILKPNINEYLPGDTIKVDYTAVGSEISDAVYYYEIRDSRGNLTKRESLTSSSGKFQFTVPEGNVPDSYTITGFITDSDGIEITRNSKEVTRLRGYILTFALDKNTYRPGETATLTYKIASIDGSAIPDKFTLRYGFLGGQYREIETSNAEGSLTLKVPDGASDGIGYFYIESDLPYGEEETAIANQQANIRTNPNPLAETVFGDLSLLELILLVLVIISLLFGIAGWRQGKRALKEAKLPPWKKERPLPEPEKFKKQEPDESMESPVPPPAEEELPPPPPEDLGLPEPPEPPRNM